MLRHEIGHSLIPVGEEYEGGYAYFGGSLDEKEARLEIVEELTRRCDS